MKHLATIFLLCAALVPCSFTQETATNAPLIKATPAEHPKTVSLPVSTAKDELRAAIHHQDQIERQISDLTAQVAKIQQQATQSLAQAQQQFAQLQAEQKQVAKAVEDARAKAYEAAHLDSKEYAFDQEKMEFSQNPPAKTEAKK